MVVKKVKIESVDDIQFKRAIDSCKLGKGINDKPKPTDRISTNWYKWQDNRSNYHLIFKDYSLKKVRHLQLDPFTCKPDPQVINNAGSRAYRKMKKYLKRYNEDINFKDNDKYLNYTWIPFEKMDTKNTAKKVIAWEYDSNSNYLAQMRKPLPYGDIVRENDYIKDGEIGFRIIFNSKHMKALETVFDKQIKADFIFKTKIYNGLVEFANNMYAERKAIIDKDKENDFKTIICAAHGNLKYHNIFMAVAIMGYSKQELLSYCNDVHVYMNTVDSIICDRPIDNIPLGTKLGQYKIKDKHAGKEFIYFGHGHKEWLESKDISHKGTKKSRIGIDHPKLTIDYKGDIIYNE